MNDRLFKIVAVLLVVGGITAGVLLGGDSSQKTRLGVEHEDKGQDHLQQGQTIYNNTDAEPPTSGPHGGAIDKGYYPQEIADENSLHNLEHGYVYISYQPNLAPEQVNKIKNLFFEPFSNSTFKPTKAIMGPRAANDAPIIFSSWDRSQKFDQFDEEQMRQYYLDNVSKSPEPFAQ